MNPKLLLRIAAVIMFLHLLGHTMGHLGWRKAEDPIKQEVIRQMTDHRFPFMGAEKSMGDYYEGYGLASALMLLLIAVLLWVLSGVEAANAALGSKVLLPLALFLFLFGIMEWVYFFPFAASFSLTSGLLSMLAWTRFRKM